MFSFALCIYICPRTFSYVLCDKDSRLTAFTLETKLMNVSGLIVNFHALGALGAYWVESTLLTKKNCTRNVKPFMLELYLKGHIIAILLAK